MSSMGGNTSDFGSRKDHVFRVFGHEETLDLRSVSEVEFRTRAENEIGKSFLSESPDYGRSNQSAMSGNENLRALVHFHYVG